MATRARLSLTDLTFAALRQQKREQRERRLIFGPDYEDNGLVFDAPDGTIWNPERLRSAYRSFAKRHGIRPLA